jgi:hypothetical protein
LAQGGEVILLLTLTVKTSSIPAVSLRKIIKQMASLKLAVVIILAMGAMIATGTIIEAKYNDAKIAQELVYHSPISYIIFALFALNLTAVIFDRYPWKKHHVGFIAAHIGLLILLAGSLLTQYYGIDGSIVLDIGGKDNKITVPETDLIVHTSLDGVSYRDIYRSEVNFLRDRPTEKNPKVISVPAGDIKITEFYPYALVDAKVVASQDKSDGPAVRFQIANDRVTQSEWLAGKKGAPVEVALGPARIILSDGPFKYTGGNVLLLKPLNQDTVAYEVYLDRTKSKVNNGTAKAGDKFNLGWMNLEFRLLKYLPAARQEIAFKKRDKASSETLSAIKFTFNGKERWMSVNSAVRLYGDSELYVLSYGNRRLPLSFDMELKKFDVGRYQGTMRAASYQSLVNIPEANKEVLISMNEPLDYKGFTFYQASFQQDEMGKPTASVLSVNYDPGRKVKYLGCLLIVFGAIHLFYRRRTKAKAAAKPKGTANA